MKSTIHVIISTLLIGTFCHSGFTENTSKGKITEQISFDKHSIELKLGLPICNKTKGLIEGTGCENFTSRFSAINLPIIYLYRFNSRFELGGGIMPSYTSVVGIPAIGAHIILTGRLYLWPDWVYLGISIYTGFPLLAAYGITIGHAIPIKKRFSIIIENNITAMMIAGIYGYWQVVAGVKYKF